MGRADQTRTAERLWRERLPRLTGRGKVGRRGDGDGLDARGEGNKGEGGGDKLHGDWAGTGREQAREGERGRERARARNGRLWSVVRLGETKSGDLSRKRAHSLPCCGGGKGDRSVACARGAAAADPKQPRHGRATDSPGRSATRTPRCGMAFHTWVTNNLEKTGRAGKEEEIAPTQAVSVGHPGNETISREPCSDSF